MLKFLFVVPLVLSLIWFAYLQANNYSFEQGRKGYFYIAIVSVFVAAFFGVILLLTR